MTNQTSSIRFENLDLLSNILHCPIGDLFEKINEHIEFLIKGFLIKMAEKKQNFMKKF